MSEQERSASGYQRVRDILEAAAQSSDADYGGLGRFWDCGVEALKSAKVHGIAMIAPEAPKSCCGKVIVDESYHRSEASGLIQGLRGTTPFDGSRFPPLPWGGQRVAESDIQFIASWIDAGCPDEGESSISDPILVNLKAEGATPIRVKDNAEFGLAPIGFQRATRPGELKQRVNLDCLPEQDLEQLRNAFRILYDLNKWPEDRRSYNNQALIHQNHCQHGWERFLTWHRAYLYEFEQNIQDFCPNLTLPYWDWTMPQYRPEQPEKGWILPKSFQAFLTVDAVKTLLTRLHPKPTPEQETQFYALAEPRQYFVSQTTFFQYVYNNIGYTHITPDVANSNRHAMIDALLQSNALWYPLRYSAEYNKNGASGTINEVIHYHYPSARDIQEIMSLNNFRDFGGGSIYDAAFGFLDQNPHNTMHIWTGGMNPYAQGKGSYQESTKGSATATVSQLAEHRNLLVKAGGRRFHSRSDLYEQPPYGDMFSNLTASYDPVFWPIHVNVDRLWWEWQKQHPHSNPEELDAILSPWNYTQRDTLNISRFGYEYVLNTCFIPVGLDTTVNRFVSQSIPVPERTQDFRKAEVRLHWVPQLDRSCFIRVFLNEPGANAYTDWRNNPHYAGYLSIFGHGACYGGPGHCAAPPPRARDYDHRTPNHNAPRNYRVDVTECARRMLDSSESLQITLVVIGSDYEEEIDLLKLEGVSLNFLD